MAWLCRLYGHQWRHPGTYEVVLVDGTSPTYPLQCATCGRKTLMGTDGSMSLDTDRQMPASIEPSVESSSDLDAVEDQPDV